jgi:hypothetical protein
MGPFPSSSPREDRGLGVIRHDAPSPEARFQPNPRSLSPVTWPAPRPPAPPG